MVPAWRRMRSCDKCRWCCWTYNIKDVPVQRRSLKVVELKPERSHCRHECDKGCDLHGTFFQPVACHGFFCPYLGGEDIHRPDTFQPLLEELGGNMGNYIPAVPQAMDVEFAKKTIRETRTVPAAALFDGNWVRVVLPLDRQPDGSWVTDEMMHARWVITI